MATVHAQSPDPWQPTLTQYRHAIHGQFGWTNRALDNRCRDKTAWADFTRTPLKAVLPSWRDDHIAYAKARHERAQSRSSLCFKDTLMSWYYNSGAKCVREHEGAWTSNTGNGYYGGFQADIAFQDAYGSEYYQPTGESGPTTTADQWAPVQQIHMAWRGWKARGWYPWPNTARICGLL